MRSYTHTPFFAHRHFVKIAAIIARIPDEQGRVRLAYAFCAGLPETNPNFDAGRFIKACMGEPVSGRDRPR